MRPILLFLLTVTAASAQPAPRGGRLVLGVWDAPPYAIRGDDGTWDGLGVEVARESAQLMGREVSFREVPADSGLAALESGRVDVLVAVLASTDAEARADLTPAYYAAALGAASRPASGLRKTVTRLFSPTFLTVAGALALVLLLVGVAAWFFERDQDDDEGFNSDTSGIWDGFWWAGVTMSTIGYGDLVPKSVGGRTLALVWMLASMGITAALTGAVVSALGIGEGSAALRLPDDLRDTRVGAEAGSNTAALLARLLGRGAPVRQHRGRALGRPAGLAGRVRRARGAACAARPATGRWTCASRRRRCGPSAGRSRSPKAATCASRSPARSWTGPAGRTGARPSSGTCPPGPSRRGAVADFLSAAGVRPPSR